MYVLACPCIRDPALRPPGITDAADRAAFAGALERCRKFGVEVITLPCPETAYLGTPRKPTTFLESLNTPAFTAIIDRFENHVRRILAARGDPLCILGVNSSPSCGVNFTHYGSFQGGASKRPGRGVFLSRFPEIRAMDVQDFARYRVYLAGPLFSEAERDYNCMLRDLLTRHFFEVHLPQEAGGDSAGLRETGEIERIYHENLRALEASDLVLAVCDGPDVDSGTAWEMGYAFVRKKPVYALRSDFRCVGTAERFNLMLECSVTMVMRKEDLPAVMHSPLCGV